MADYLCISIRFLDSRFHGRSDTGQPEWPPSPLRLFQALVAAAAARWNQRRTLSHAQHALRWLAQLPPPYIAAPEPQHLRPYYLSVPNNAMDLVAKAWSRGVYSGAGDANPATHRTMKKVQPLLLPENAFLSYLWPLSPDQAEQCHQHLPTLDATARSLVALGWGIDLAAACASCLDAQRAAELQRSALLWQPVISGGSVQLRVPAPGTLDELTRRHHDFLQRLHDTSLSTLQHLHAFHLVPYRCSSIPAPRPYVPFRLRHPIEDRNAYFHLRRANHVAAMARHAVALLAQRQGKKSDWIDRYVHGHRSPEDDSQPRFSYLPLPSLERRGPQGVHLGGIRRLLIAELIDSPNSHVDWLRYALPGTFLTDDKTHSRQALLIPLAQNDWVLQRYLGPAYHWATVTPVVLPGSDDGKPAKTLKLFTKALHHAGIDPELLADEPIFQPFSFWPSGEPALSYHRPDYLRRGYWSVYHVCLRWKVNFPGPLALGAGRHCGLGIFASGLGQTN